MVSRLDRLFILLDTGSNECIRMAAAKQLGEVQRIQPHDLGHLLDRIKEYSCKPNWETRVAAGLAIRCVLENVPKWSEAKVKLETDDEDRLQRARELVQKSIDTERILREFDLDDIINNCPTLLSTNSLVSDDLEASTSSRSSRGKGRKGSLPSRKPSREQLQRQRNLINKELGMAMVDSLGCGVKSTDIISNDDLQVDYSVDTCPTGLKSTSAPQILRDKTSHHAKILASFLEAKCLAGTDFSDAKQSSTIWPLASIVEHFDSKLFDASWETRHGSAISLREIVKLQGRCAGKQALLAADINDKLNELWLTDMALKAICVLSLDRFGDFLFDQVIAPVRENVAQLLGCCVSLLPDGCVNCVIDLLVRMLGNPSWETRHGGMLGLKYSLSVLDKHDLKMTTRRTFDSIFKCLADTNDDVSAEAAATLVLVKDLLLETIPDKTPNLIKFLWDHLADLDELTASTSNIILLLSSLITANSTQLDLNELNKSISKLWPLLNHPSTTVRVSVLKALVTLSQVQTRPCLLWMPEDLITVALRLIFQRSIIENMDEVHAHIQEAWNCLTRLGTEQEEVEAARTLLLKCTSQCLNYWFCLTMQPSNVPIDRGYCLWLNISSDGAVGGSKPEGDLYIGSSTFNAETIDLQKTQITKCRFLGAQLLGALYSKLTRQQEGSQHARETLKYLSDMFVHYLSMKSANQRMISAWVLESWACNKCDRQAPLPEAIASQLKSTVKDTTLCYDELASAFTRLQQEARDFASALKSADINSSPTATTDKRIFYNLNQIQSMCDLNIEHEMTRATSKKLDATKTPDHDIKDGPFYLSLVSKKHILTKSYQTTKASLRALSLSTLSSAACALVAWGQVPDKVGLLLDPLLESIESESETLIQMKSIHHLVRLIDKLCSKLDDNREIIHTTLDRLISAMYTCAMCLVADESNGDSSRVSSLVGDAPQAGEHRVILLDNLQRKAEQVRGASRRQSSVSATATLKRSHSQTSASDEIELEGWDTSPLRDEKLRMASVGKTIGQLVQHFGDKLPLKLPYLWQTITEGMRTRIDEHNSQVGSSDPAKLEAQIVKDLLTSQVIGEQLDKSLLGHLAQLPEHLLRLLESPNPMIRHHVGQYFGVMSKIMFDVAEPIIRQKIIPMLESDSVISRCGAIETIALIIEKLHLDLVPKMDLFTVHVLRRLGDQNDQVRQMATHCFGKILSLMPLKTRGQHEHEPNNSGETKNNSLLAPDEDLGFIEQLLDPKKLKDHKLQFETGAQLRSYQQEGLNWLAFLNRYNLHGILCDEMGLGKTFMTICMVASDHSSATTGSGPSLIVCPPTLIEHWLYEIEKFVPVKTALGLHPVSYRGGTIERNSIQKQLQDATGTKEMGAVNLVVTSYDVVRSDVDFFKTIHWNYCVLDEGHIIKNGRTKLSRAVRLLTAKHRLILSGTPIQNSVTELWSLFDFLMPGFLGSERQFNARYARPILQSREPKCSSKDLEAGALAMESLHRQVLPFILRRLKEDVLDDLPPKILQDYYCELSPLQSKLYEDFKRGKLCKDVTRKSLSQLKEGKLEDLKLVDSRPSESTRGHVFQALQYLKSVCNHPKLVMTPKHSQLGEIKKYLETEKSSLDDISHSSKLTALKQLLFDCGIGVSEDPQQAQQKSAPELESVVNQHRALIFCQLRSMVEIIESDLFKSHLPKVTYLRLDGSVPANQRQAIVSRFNNDPSIDVLLLTTHIGGLGLNLTGADTVIFVEHDWNPTRDLQAMDRAHRIGQKRVVNVYRLITKDTLEERIMGLQKFKTMVSNTVINQDNTGLGTMNVDQLLDLFGNSDEDDRRERAKSGDTEGSRRKSESRRASVAELLPDLWDQQQYETEYDLDSFVASLKS